VALSIAVVDAAPAQQLVVAVWTDELMFQRRETVQVHVEVGAFPDMLPGASVHVEAVDPRGRIRFRGDGITDRNGEVSFRFRPSPRTGEWTVTATASLAGYEDGSDATTFDVVR